MIRATMKPGRLIITADNEARADLAQAYRDRGYYRAQGYVSDALHECMSFVRPEDIGALTDAPILAEYDGWTIEDDGTFILEDDARVFWFPDYMIRDPWEELRNRGHVEFMEATQ